MSACISYKLGKRRLKHAQYMSSWVSISRSIKYEIYSSIDHGNVIEQQMPGIHIHNQIGYTSTVITLNSHVWYTLYIFSSLCSFA